MANLNSTGFVPLIPDKFVLGNLLSVECIIKILHISTLLLCSILSVYFSVSLWISLSPSKVYILIFGLIGLSLELSKILCLPIIKWHWYNKKIFKFCIFILIYLLLIFVSLLSAISQIESIVLDNYTKYEKKISMLEENDKEIKIQQDLIFNLKELAQISISKGLLTKGNNILINNIPLEQEKLRSMKVTIRNKNVNAISELPLNQVIKILTSFFSLTPKLCITLLSVLLGFMIDLCGFLLIFSIDHIKTGNANRKKIKNNIFVKKKIKETNQPTCVAQDLRVTNKEQYLYIKKLISSKTEPPILRHIRNLMGIGTKTVIKHFQSLQDEGIIRKENNRYMLI